MATHEFATKFLAVDYYTKQIDPKTFNILVDIKDNKNVSRYINKKTYSICRKIMSKSL